MKTTILFYKIPLMLLTLVLMFCTSCKDNISNLEDPKMKTAQAADISEVPVVSTPAIIPLPDMDFDLEKFGEKEIENNHPLSTAEQQQLQLGEIDRPLYQTDLSDFNYYLLKEIYKGKEGKILLLSRTAENEALAWLATYDAQDKLIDHQTVYYDEWAESAVNNTSVIRKNRITLRQYKMDLETGKDTTKTKVFEIGSDLKFIEVYP